MSTYAPDKFVLIDYGTDYALKERYAILAGFYGGFAATLGSAVALLLL